MFTLKQRDLIKAQWCVSNVVWKVTNYFYNALTSKWVYTGWNLIFPTKYILQFSWWNNQIVSLKYFSWNDSSWITGTYYIFKLTWSDEDIKWWCYSQKYYVELSWDLKIVMQPGLEGWAWKEGIVIEDDPSIKTGVIYFKFVWYWYTWKILWKLIIDKRVDLLHYVPCLIWTGWNVCLKYAGE